LRLCPAPPIPESAMIETVRGKLLEEGLVSAGDRVLVAVSGGADSVALLHLLHSLGHQLDLVLSVAHLDHGIRPESVDDADFVRRLCRDLDVSLTVERVDLPSLARERRQGLEEAARDVRRSFLLEVAGREGSAAIALGHHRGDQAETFLHRLVRGSGTTGLAAMQPKSGPFIRPLLEVSKAQILDYLARHGLGHVEDGSNADLALTRNRIRHELLPLLRQFNPRIEEHFARLSKRLAGEEDFWRGEELRALERVGRVEAGELWLEREGLLALHPALRSRVLRRALAQVRGSSMGICAAHIEALDEVLSGRRPQAECHLPGAWAARRYDRLWLRRSPPGPAPVVSLSIPGPGRYRLPDGNELAVSLEDGAWGEGRDAVEFAAAKVSFPLLVRTVRPGDRFRPSGMEGRKKLKDFFVDEKVDTEARGRILLVEAFGEILWVAGVRRCEGARPEDASGTVLRMVLNRQGVSTIRL